MALLNTPSPARGGGPVARSGSLGRNIALITLTIQNSSLIVMMHFSRMMPQYGHHRYSASTAVLLSEVIKLALSLTLAIYDASTTLAPSTPATILFEQIYNAVFSRDGWKTAFPAVCFTLQNLLQYVALENLDPVHFQVLYQVKIITTAVFTVIILRRQLGHKRWLSLFILTLGVAFVSYPSSENAGNHLLHGLPEHYFPRSNHEIGQAGAIADLSTPDSHLTKRSATYQGIANDQFPPEPLMNYSVGLTAALVAAIVSGLASVYFEQLLKESSPHANVWIRNIQLSLYSLIAVMLGGVMWQDGSAIHDHGFFEGYNWVVWVVIILQAAGGLISSLVIRDADNIVKNFATSISILISFVMSVWMFDFSMTMSFFTGTSLVLLATYIYSCSDHDIGRPPPLRMASFEKPAIERLLTPGATPRATDSSRLNLDPFDTKSSAMTTSRPNSPLLPRQASRAQDHREE